MVKRDTPEKNEFRDMAPTPTKLIVTTEAKEMLIAAGARDLTKAIAKLESVNELTVAVLEGLGMGCPDGVRLLDCSTAEESTWARNEVASALLKEDARLRVLYGIGNDAAAKARSALLAVGRKLVSLVQLIRESRAEGGKPTANPNGGNGQSTYVFTENEEERSFTMLHYDQGMVKAQEEVLLKMYYIELRPFEKPGHAQLKKTAYWVKNEGCWPDAERLPLSAFRRAPTDSAYILFKRKVVGVMIVAAGEKPWSSCSDAGAEVKKHGPQWAHAKVLEGLVKEVEELRERLTPDELTFVVEVMDESLCRSTRTACETATAAARGQIAKVGEHVAAARGGLKDRGKGDAGRVRDRKRGTPEKGGKERKGGGGMPKVAKPATAAVPRDEKGWKGGAVVTFKDEEGQLGPNGLPRKKGGNPAGSKCSRLASLGTCPFATCSYSHIQ